MEHIIKKLNKVAKNQGYHTMVVFASDKVATDQLHLFLELDEEKKEQVIVIYDYQSSPFVVAKQKEGLHYLEFKLVFPFVVHEMALNDIASLLHFINHNSSFPGFELDELSSRVSFRYIWIVQIEENYSSVFEKIIHNIQLNLKLFSPLLKQVATAKRSFNDVLKEIANAFSQNNS